MTGRTPIEQRERLTTCISLLVAIAPKYEREYDVPMGWATDVAAVLSDVAQYLRDRQTVGVTCAWCHEPLTQPARGRRRKYCPEPKRCRHKAAGLR